ncbi:hypothetical protein M0R45_030758 [Rubus argutus]|uniref:Uncharacterized protein n=1 Tax=Rubus argutus TaxID=59490 RepID=A0AAW1WCT8_RUBAR
MRGGTARTGSGLNHGLATAARRTGQCEKKGTAATGHGVDDGRDADWVEEIGHRWMSRTNQPLPTSIPHHPSPASISCPGPCLIHQPVAAALPVTVANRSPHQELPSIPPQASPLIAHHSRRQHTAEKTGKKRTKMKGSGQAGQKKTEREEESGRPREERTEKKNQADRHTVELPPVPARQCSLSRAHS